MIIFDRSSKFLCLLLVLQCVASSSGTQTQANSTSVTVAQTLSNYSYELQNQWPLTWEDCDVEVNAIQSPVAINTQQLASDCPEAEQIRLSFSDAVVPYKLEGSSLSIDYQYSMLHIIETATGKVTHYQSNSVHFHSHGEHVIDGTQGDIEVHIKYRRIQGKNNTQALVLALPVLSNSPVPVHLQRQEHDSVGSGSSGANSSNNTQTPSNAPSNSEVLSFISLYDREESHLINPNKLFALLKSAGFYKYVGSMSAPPCISGITWLISDKPATISPEDLLIWRLLINGGKPNNREVSRSLPTINYYPNKCLQGPLRLTQVNAAALYLATTALLILLLQS